MSKPNKTHLTRRRNKTCSLRDIPWCSTKSSDLLLNVVRITKVIENGTPKAEVCQKCLKAVNEARAAKGMKPLNIK